MQSRWFVVLVTLLLGAGCGDDGDAPGGSDATSSGEPGATGSGASAAGGSPGTGAGGSSAEGGTTSSSSAGSGGMPSPCAGGPTEIDLHEVTLYSNPPTLADWPVTTTLTQVDFTNDGVHVAFSKIDGPERWPDIVPPGWDGPLQYTLGMVECIDGAWHGSAVMQYWYGLYAQGGNVALDNQIAVNWYYDEVRWGILAGRQPATGETVGIFVAAGNLRNVTEDDPAQSPVKERSNVVLLPMPDDSGSQHSF